MGLVGVPCLKKTMIPNAFIGLQREEVSVDERNGRPYNLDNDGKQKQVRPRLRREGESRTA